MESELDQIPVSVSDDRRGLALAMALAFNHWPKTFGRQARPQPTTAQELVAMRFGYVWDQEAGGTVVVWKALSPPESVG